jgi:predicted transcriptional regulator
MPSSKLELCIGIVKSLIESGPLTVEQLTILLKANPPSLDKQLGFLIDQEMVKKEDAGLNATYTVAMRGIKVLKFFKVLPSTRIEV